MRKDRALTLAFRSVRKGHRSVRKGDKNGAIASVVVGVGVEASTTNEQHDKDRSDVVGELKLLSPITSDRRARFGA